MTDLESAPAVVTRFPLACGLVTLILPTSMSQADYDRLRSVLADYLTLAQPALVRDEGQP